LKTAIIFGANGQDGNYLYTLLSKYLINVICTSRTHGTIIGNVTDLTFVENLIKNTKPDFIFHFAANSTTSHSVIFENHSSISTGTLNILESAYKFSPHSKIFISGSAVQFYNSSKPIDEQTPFRASSAYSAERIYSVYLARYYREKFNLKCYIGYLFNHDSPYRTEKHINQKIIKTALRIYNGSKEKLIIGDTSVKKEFNFAGDIVLAIWKFINQDDQFEMVIGSGKAYSIQNWIEYCFEKNGLNWLNHTIIDKKFVSDYKILVSNPSLLLKIGWEPKLNFFELADLMLSSNQN